MDITKLKSLAANDNAMAQNDLGIAYLTGDGVAQDEQIAVYWFFCAASHGSPEAMANLGMCYLLGKGLQKDLGKALYLLESSYLLGISQVISDVLGALQSKIVDIKEITALSDAKNAQATWILGLCYDHGICVDINHLRAYELLNESGNNDNPVALWILAHFVANQAEPDLLGAKVILDKVEVIAKKQVGGLGNAQIIQDMLTINAKLRNNRSYLLLKVIPECKRNGLPNDKYVQDLLDGKLYMKSLDQFGDLFKRDIASANDFRGDILEGYSESFGVGYNPHLYKADSNGTIFKDGLLGSIDVLALRKKVYCFTAIDYYKPNRTFILPSPRMKEFGKYAVIIHDVDEFLKRVHKAFDKYQKESNSAYRLAYNRVFYDVDMSSKIKFNEFHKSVSYLWQNEFRISLDFSMGRFGPKTLAEVTDFAKMTFPGKIEVDENPLSLSDWIYFEIGDIRDICQCVETDGLFSKTKKIHLNKEPIEIKPFEPPQEPRPTFCKAITSVVTSNGKRQLVVSKEAFYSAII